jgi:hypothetical protein
MRLHVVRFGSAQVSEAGLGQLPFVLGEVEFACGMPGAAEPVVGAGLLILLTGMRGEFERLTVVFTGEVELAGSEQGLTEAVQRCSCIFPESGRAEQCQSLLEVAGGLVIVAEPLLDYAEAGQ